MILYRKEDRYDTKTGQKLAPVMTEIGWLCDFTGEFGRYPEELGATFDLNYNSIDPCCGCGIGENEFAKKYKVDVHSFLLGSPYIFKDGEDEHGLTVMDKLLETAKMEEFDRGHLDQLFRWSRIRTADRLLSSGRYTIEDLGMEVEEWMNEEDEED